MTQDKERVIKFRAWNKDKKVMVYEGDFIIGLGGDIKGYSDDDGGKSGLWEHTYKVNVILMQFTGLLDKDGKEIYEGDILASMNNDFKPPYKFEWVVIYERGAFIADRADKQGETWMAYWTEKEFEVIGNIYSNPELLKEV